MDVEITIDDLKLYTKALSEKFPIGCFLIRMYWNRSAPKVRRIAFTWNTK